MSTDGTWEVRCRCGQQRRAEVNHAFNSGSRAAILTQYHARNKQTMTVTNYTRELADTICSRMTEGESLRAICRTPGFPSEGTVRGWAVRDHDGFGERYRAARALLVEYWADQIIDIADEPDLDPRDRQIRVHTQQWLMSKLVPRRWGTKLELSGDPEHPVQLLHKEVSVSTLTNAQIDALMIFCGRMLEHGPGGVETEEYETLEPGAPALIEDRRL